MPKRNRRSWAMGGHATAAGCGLRSRPDSLTNTELGMVDGPIRPSTIPSSDVVASYRGAQTAWWPFECPLLPFDPARAGISDSAIGRGSCRERGCQYV